MIRTLLLLVGLFSTSLLIAQEQQRSGRPDIPGTFQVDFGWNYATGTPDNFDLNLWGSRTVNLYYQLDYRLFSSKFFVSPGFGLGLDRFKFDNKYTLSLQTTTDEEILQLVPGPEGTKKSFLIGNYADVPVELRFVALPDDPVRSFKFAVGFRGGLLIDSSTKVKYKVDSQTEKLKTKQDWHLNPYRYGVYARLSIGNFNFFVFDNLSPLFRKGEGPESATKEITYLSGGISITGF